MYPQLHPLSSPSPSFFICKMGKLLSVAPTSQGHCGSSQSDGTFLVWGQVILWGHPVCRGMVTAPCSLPPDAHNQTTVPPACDTKNGSTPCQTAPGERAKSSPR